MRAELIDGKEMALQLRGDVAHGVRELRGLPHEIQPGLAVVLVGQNPASEVYVRSKVRLTAEVGMMSFKHELEENVAEKDLLSLIGQLNRNREVHGILVQLPLPEHINAHAVINAIDPEKDVDGFSVSNVGRLTVGQKAFVPCTPLGCLQMLRRYHGSLSGLSAVVVGRSNIVGKPMATLLLRENCTVTIAHSQTCDLAAICKRADILVAAVGKPNFIQGSWIGHGATVIDVGINRVTKGHQGAGKTNLIGDVDFKSACRHAGAITPVPGGVGPMTIACLLANTLTACHRSLGLDDPVGLPV